MTRRTRRIIKSEKAPVKHVPLRTCVACRQVKAKRELIRLVRTPDGAIEVDSSGKKTGRGAYLCREWICWQTGLKENRLAHTLRTDISPDERGKLLEYGRELLKGAE